MLIDVSHVIEHGMITYRGLPAPPVKVKNMGTFPVRAFGLVDGRT